MLKCHVSSTSSSGVAVCRVHRAYREAADSTCTSVDREPVCRFLTITTSPLSGATRIS